VNALFPEATNVAVLMQSHGRGNTISGIELATENQKASVRARQVARYTGHSVGNPDYRTGREITRPWRGTYNNTVTLDQ